MRYLLISLCVGVLFISYHYKTENYAAFLTDKAWKLSLDGQPLESNWAFVLNKLMRFLLNDFVTIGLIQLLFQKLAYTKFAFGVMVFSLLVLLPLFFLANALSWPSTFVSMLHRLTMNPVLLMLLIPAFYFQVKKDGEVGS